MAWYALVDIIELLLGDETDHTQEEPL